MLTLTLTHLLPALLLLPPLLAFLPPSPLHPTLHQQQQQQQQAPLCGNFCRFSICSANSSLPLLRPAPFIILGPPNLPSNRFICQRHRTNRTLLITATGEPEIAISNTLIPLTRWRPPNLTPPFPPRYLRTLLTSPGRRQLYGISSSPPRGNQWSFLHNRCFILPIRRFRAANQVVDVSAQRDACVAFRTRAPSLHVQLTWESNGDGDLVVQEGSGRGGGGMGSGRGEVVDFLNMRSRAGGRLVGDNGIGTCDDATFPGYTENVEYFPGRAVPSGDWIAEVWQAGDCGRNGTSTRWTLRVIRDGVVTAVRRGVARFAGLYQRVGQLRFVV